MAVGPHGGFAAALPNNQGFAEVLLESEPVNPGATPKVQVVAYFLAADLTSPLTTLPTAVSARLLFPDKEPETVSLSPQPKPEVAAGVARFASQPGPYFLDEPLGDLTGTLGGQQFKVAFRGIR